MSAETKAYAQAQLNGEFWCRPCDRMRQITDGVCTICGRSDYGRAVAVAPVETPQKGLRWCPQCEAHRPAYEGDCCTCGKPTWPSRHARRKPLVVSLVIDIDVDMLAMDPELNTALRTIGEYGGSVKDASGVRR